MADDGEVEVDAASGSQASIDRTAAEAGDAENENEDDDEEEEEDEEEEDEEEMYGEIVRCWHALPLSSRCH